MLFRSYAVDGIVEETVFLAGPVLAAGVVAVAAPGYGIAAAEIERMVGKGTEHLLRSVLAHVLQPLGPEHLAAAVATAAYKRSTTAAGVFELLLANHPLDCPICDQAGECSLQDYSYNHGQEDSRYDFFRRTFIDVDMGPSIKKNMNRCIHCTRCIRFGDEVAGIREMVALQHVDSGKDSRGWVLAGERSR